MSVTSVALLTAAAVVTSLRGLPVMAEEELTMFFYVGFATLLFLLPASLVSAELGSAYSNRGGGVYTWVGEAFGQRWGFVAIWLQWIQNVVWYPTGLSFAAAAVAYGAGDTHLANSNLFVGVFCIAAYWLATLLALRGGTGAIAKAANYGFIVGTVIPGVVLIGMFVWWAVTGHTMGWSTTQASAVTQVVNGHSELRFWPQLAGLGSLAFLGNILLLFAGVEVQAVHVRDMKDPRRGFPAAMMLAAIISVALFALGALAIAGIVPYGDLQLQTGVFTALSKVLNLWHVGWAQNLLALMICFGALGGALAWLTAPSRGLLSTAHDGLLPPFMQKTNTRGVQRNILLIQAVIVTAISSLYIVLPDVSGAFFLISSMTITLYIVMYLLMYAAAIRLRRTQPDLARPFSIPGGSAGMWLCAGIGFVGAAFALVVSFFPPAQLAIGTPTTYVLLVAGGLIIFTAAPLIVYQRRMPSWQDGTPDQLPHEATFNSSAVEATEAVREHARRVG